MSIFVKNFFNGFFFGMGNVVPGMSGGTIAVSLGFFDNMLSAINGLFKDFRKQLAFLLPFALGVLSGIVFFIMLIGSLLKNLAFPTSLLFAGLVAGCVPLIAKYAFKNGFKLRYIACVLAAFAAVAFMALFRPASDPSAASAISPQFMFLMFIGGVIGAIAMIIPGISGSFVLLLMGLYYPAVNNLSAAPSIPVLAGTAAPLLLGVVTGALLISKILAYILEKYSSACYSLILGFLFGSIFTVLYDASLESGKNPVSPTIFAVGIVFLAAGTAATYFLSRNELKKKI